MAFITGQSFNWGRPFDEVGTEGLVLALGGGGGLEEEPGLMG